MGALTVVIGIGIIVGAIIGILIVMSISIVKCVREKKERKKVWEDCSVDDTEKESEILKPKDLSETVSLDKEEAPKEKPKLKPFKKDEKKMEKERKTVVQIYWHAESNDYWICSFCDAENRYDDEYCEVCQSKNTRG